MFQRVRLALLSLFFVPIIVVAGDDLAVNGSFAHGFEGWEALWTRQSDAGQAVIETNGDRTAVCIHHSGSNDWSFQQALPLTVEPGDLIEMEAFVRITNGGAASICVSLWDSQHQNLGWSFGDRNVHGSMDWRQLRSRFIVPAGVVSVIPRFIGYQASTTWMTGFKVFRTPHYMATMAGKLPSELSLSNSVITVGVTPGSASFSVKDHRTGRLWTQWVDRSDFLFTKVEALPGQLLFDFLDVGSGLTGKGRLVLDREKPEFTVHIVSQGVMESSLAFPHPFVSRANDRLIIPMNEGISYPADDLSVSPMTLIAYGGHGICMAFWGITDGSEGYSAIIESPDDALIEILRHEGLLCIRPLWEAQKGEFGYSRVLRYTFFNKGGHVAIAKRYRQYAKDRGFFKTLAEKRRENPNVDLLMGAVNVWNWDADPVAMVREMQSAGIEHILWSRGGGAAALKTLNELGVLTSRYDIYQDVMNPGNFPLLQWCSSEWTTNAWPDGIIHGADGQWVHGWGVEAKAGGLIDCGVICDKLAPEFARQRIPADLASNPYRCRFIDTTTAAPWNECYDSRHPMTRTESRVWKMKLLDYVSHDMKLVTGCETGHDASVPYLHYFEGMLSLGPYRVPDAGRNMDRILEVVPENVAKFQLGQRYRLPLWELVFHDCVVAQWYWGDYNNKLPALWDKRDLFNVLYGTPPMFMFNKELWQQQKARFVQSYKNTCPWVRSVGYSEMTDHRFLTSNRDVQQTEFANGTVITVNFGKAPYRLPDGSSLPPGGYHVATGR
jgi:hypothetical protein